MLLEFEPLFEDELLFEAELLPEEELPLAELLFEPDAFVVEVVTGSVKAGFDDSLLDLAEPAGLPWDPAVAGPLGAGAVDVAGVEGPDFED